MATPKFPETETMNVSEARRQFSETLDRVRRREARVVVEKSGIPVGAMVSMEDFARLTGIDERRAELLATLAESRKAFAGIPPEEIEDEIEKAIAEVKEEERVARARAVDAGPRP